MIKSGVGGIGVKMTIVFLTLAHRVIFRLTYNHLKFWKKKCQDTTVELQGNVAYCYTDSHTHESYPWF